MGVAWDRQGTSDSRWIVWWEADLGVRASSSFTAERECDSLRRNHRSPCRWPPGRNRLGWSHGERHAAPSRRSLRRLSCIGSSGRHHPRRILGPPRISPPPPLDPQASEFGRHEPTGGGWEGRQPLRFERWIRMEEIGRGAERTDGPRRPGIDFAPNFSFDIDPACSIRLPRRPVSCTDFCLVSRTHSVTMAKKKNQSAQQTTMTAAAVRDFARGGPMPIRHSRLLIYNVFARASLPQH